MKETRVFIADQDMRICLSLQEMLERQGYLVVGQAQDGAEAVTAIRQIRPDMALLDVPLPQISGIEVARLVTREQLTPVLLMSSVCDRTMAQEAREAGVLGYLMKPIQESELMPSIEIARTRWHEHTTQKHVLYELQEKLDTRTVIDQAKAYLMDQGMHEVEAFRKIQRLAMNSRKTMKEVAQAILLAQQISV
ncbi:MAG: response regulator [Chloroflexaceae bacterium]|nr:response regulator [Chloroflexaceae bacterium]